MQLKTYFFSLDTVQKGSKNMSPNFHAQQEHDMLHIIIFIQDSIQSFCAPGASLCHTAKHFLKCMYFEFIFWVIIWIIKFDSFKILIFHYLESYFISTEQAARNDIWSQFVSRYLCAKKIMFWLGSKLCRWIHGAVW